MYVKFLRGGLSTSIQDRGRLGYAACGVPESGFMDDYTANLTNLIAGNEQDKAVLEITVLGPKLHFSSAARIVLGGLGVEAYLNKERVNLFEAISVEGEDVLDIKRVVKGNFAYLAVIGGFQTEERLSSRSMFEGISKESRFKEGDTIEITSYQPNVRPAHAKVRFEHERYQQQKIAVWPGPEFDLLTKEERKELFDRPFTLTADCNRMAFSFDETIFYQTGSMLTAPVLPGTVQLTSGGRLIVLMRDAQVTGGYSRILQLPEEWLGVLAQKTPGEQVTLQLKEQAGDEED